MSVAEPLSRPPDGNYGSAIARCLGINRKHKGTGFRVEKDYILTCAHVVKQCLNISKKTDEVLTAEVTGKTMEIVFLADPTKSFVAVEVVPELWRFGGEDIAVLKLSRAVPDAVAVISLKQGQEFWHHKFQLFGFPEDRWDGRWATGEILGAQPETGRVQLEGTKNQGLGIQEGFSGSPVWDENLGGVVGMTVARDEDEPTKIGFMIPYEKLKTVLEAIALFDILQTKEIYLEPHWRNAYRLVVPRPEFSGMDENPFPETLIEAILRTQTISSRSEEYEPIVQFVSYFALDTLGLTEIKPRINSWLQGRQHTIKEVLDFVQEKARKRLPHQKTNPIFNVLFVVEGEWNSTDYAVKAILVENKELYNPKAARGFRLLKSLQSMKEGDEKLNWSEVEIALQLSLKEALKILKDKQQNPSSLQINIWLPRNCCFWDIDRWGETKKSAANPNPRPIGARHKVVFRLTERLTAEPQAELDWESKWDLLQENRDSISLIDGNTKPPIDLFEELNHDDVVGWYRYQPINIAKSEDEPCHFSILVGSGAPVATWLRGDPKKFKAKFNAIAKKHPNEIPAIVEKLRKEAHTRSDKSKPHIGEHIGLILEDPKLVPPGITNRF
ncbi:MAG: trypsin-like peptidase domain-containing protein [Pseudanabaena sp.]|jgi:hypothetical protein